MRSKSPILLLLVFLSMLVLVVPGPALANSGETNDKEGDAISGVKDPSDGIPETPPIDNDPPDNGDPELVGPPAPPVNNPPDNSVPQPGDDDFVGPVQPPEGSDGDDKPEMTPEERAKDEERSRRNREAMQGFGNFLGDAAGGIAGSYIKNQQREAGESGKNRLSEFNGRATRVDLDGMSNVDRVRGNDSISRAQQIFDPFTVTQFNRQTTDQVQLANRIADENRNNAVAIEKMIEADKASANQITSAIGGLLPGGNVGSYVGGGVKDIFSGVFGAFGGSGKSDGAGADKPDEAPLSDGIEGQTPVEGGGANDLPADQQVQAEVENRGAEGADALAVPESDKPESNNEEDR